MSKMKEIALSKENIRNFEIAVAEQRTSYFAELGLILNLQGLSSLYMRILKNLNL